MDLTQIPSLNWLRIFEAAARHQGFAAAARELGMSTPAVSQQVRALEVHLHQPLFDREAHGVTLTEAGRDYLNVVQNALESIKLGTSAIFGEARNQPLVLRAALIFAHAWLAPRLPGFRQKHPEVRLHLSTGNYEEDFQRGGADLQIVFDAAKWSPDLSDALFQERLYPVCTAEVAAKITRPSDLTAVQLIETVGHIIGWRDVFEVLGESALYEARAGELDRLHTDNTMTALMLAGEGMGVMLARAPVTDTEIERRGLVRPFDIEISSAQKYALVRRPGPMLSDAARSFRTWLLDEVQDL